MAFLLGLCSIYAVLWLASFAFHGILDDWQMRGNIAAAIMFILVGISHFAKREQLEAMIPESWPYRRAMNYMSGTAEIMLGIGLLYSGSRAPSAIGLLLLLAAVFPANIFVARSKPNTYNISRLFFQPIYMVWVWLFCLHGQL